MPCSSRWTTSQARNSFGGVDVGRYSRNRPDLSTTFPEAERIEYKRLVA